jgi:hypothetical protein
MDVRWSTEGLMFVAKALSTALLRKYQGSEQHVSLCALENIKLLTSVKEAVFSVTLIWRAFPVVSTPPSSRPTIFPKTRRITRNAVYSNTTDEQIFSEALIRG